MSSLTSILGIDVGSVAVGIVELGLTPRRILTSDYRIHHGAMQACLRAMLAEIDLSRVGWVAATSSAGELVRVTETVDNQLACIAAAHHLHERVGSIVLIGGEKFSLLRFDAAGRYVGGKGSTPCAAGTGSFLDQQARRLGLEDSAALADQALASRSEIPRIATRCSVFAKTDLIHAQQEGYNLRAICNGLCFGLATNAADALLAGEKPPEPVIFAGGVARNDAVLHHLAERIGCHLEVDPHAHLYGALGSAVLMSEKLEKAPGDAAHLGRPLESPEDLLRLEQRPRQYDYPPLELRLSDYPSLRGEQRYEFRGREAQTPTPIEVDVYEQPSPGATTEAYLGIDIGSTSTKAVLLGRAGGVLAGFYTRTAGRPLGAVQGICEAIEAWCRDNSIDLHIVGAGTTGSGRKFIGAILGADLIVDEITAHARAAYELDPEVDTIIEIGGQDAKFTTLRRGMVTFSVMNTVCAAGTGSFIEEQAHKLDCPLDAYADRTAGVPAPMASDRCTVFMERDINHYISASYSVDETLAAVLHSVRENYLCKVARPALIGKKICFQGATAKNRSLVAAFEQKLGQPISVSKYCHLTGALGVAYLLNEQQRDCTGFVGTNLYRSNIPVNMQVCDICTNHCKIHVADVHGRKVAYGFLCGRDYESERYVTANRSGFDMLKQRRRAFPVPSLQHAGSHPKVGIPPALYLVDELPRWKKFFAELGIEVVTAIPTGDPIAEGKRLAGAEFCAPIAAFLGSAVLLAQQCDFVFVPIYQEIPTKQPELRRQFCYYSQFASSLAAAMTEAGLHQKAIMPLVHYHNNSAFGVKANLFKALRKAFPRAFSFFDLSAAFDAANDYLAEGTHRLKQICAAELARSQDISVCLLGRPYTVLSRQMNKHIPDIFAKMGVKAFSQDMLPVDAKDAAAIADLLEAVNWHYAAELLTAAEYVSKTPGLYPVLLTSFKCAPDSCILEYFKRILDKEGKPYLVLQLDEHDSRVGYETRIEAGIRSFRNHHTAKSRPPRAESLPVIPKMISTLRGRTLLLPNWDRLACTLLTALLRAEGLDARLLHEDAHTIQRSLALNAGQCIPMTAIAQGAIEYIETHDLDPKGTTLWLLGSQVSCNIRLFPYYIKSLLEAYGRGMEHVSMYCGDISFVNVSATVAINSYFAFLLAGNLRKMACKIRPYECEPGATDAAVEKGLEIFTAAFAQGHSKMVALERVITLFKSIKTQPQQRPKVALFGDLYSRDNDVMNQEVIRTIEAHGGEVITTPYNEYARMVAGAYFRKWFREGKYLPVFANSTLLATANILEGRYMRKLAEVLGDRPRRSGRSVDEILSLFRMTSHHTGESFDNVLKVFHLIEEHPDLALFVQLNPAFCCPSLVTEAMAGNIERHTGVPVVTITYDGTLSCKNDAVIPYLANWQPREKRMAPPHRYVSGR